MNAYLFVCSANMLRSPTAEHVARSMGFSADSAGAVPEWAVRPLTVEAIQRAEHIVCMERSHADAVLKLVPDCVVQVWNIPDDFDYCSPELVAMIRKRLETRVPVEAYPSRNETRATAGAAVQRTKEA